MFESFKRSVRKVALGAALGSTVMSGESAHADTAPVTTSAEVKKETTSQFKDGMAEQIEKMMKFPNDIKFHEKYTKEEKINLMLDLTEKYFKVSGEYQMLNMNIIKDPEKLHGLQDNFTKHYSEYRSLVKGLENGSYEIQK